MTQKQMTQTNEEHSVLGNSDCNGNYLSDGALYFVRACIRSLAKCCCAVSVGWVILHFSAHHSTCRSYARDPNVRPQCGHTSLMGPILCLRIDRRCNGVSCVANFGGSVRVGVTRRGIVVDLFDASYTLEIYPRKKRRNGNNECR